MTRDNLTRNWFCWPQRFPGGRWVARPGYVHNDPRKHNHETLPTQSLISLEDKLQIVLCTGCYNAIIRHDRHSLCWRLLPSNTRRYCRQECRSDQARKSECRNAEQVRLDCQYMQYLMSLVCDWHGVWSMSIDSVVYMPSLHILWTKKPCWLCHWHSDLTKSKYKWTMQLIRWTSRVGYTPIFTCKILFLQVWYTLVSVSNKWFKKEQHVLLIYRDLPLLFSYSRENNCHDFEDHVRRSYPLTKNHNYINDLNLFLKSTYPKESFRKRQCLVAVVRWPWAFIDDAEC